MTRARIEIPQDAIAAFCRKHHITWLAPWLEGQSRS
jgi:hypothetical protein